MVVLTTLYYKLRALNDSPGIVGNQRDLLGTWKRKIDAQSVIVIGYAGYLEIAPAVVGNA